MEYLENFKSRFEDYYKKTREVSKTRECIIESILTTRRTTRAQYLTELRNISEEALSPTPVLMVSEKKQHKTPPKKMDRLERMKLWKAEKLKKIEDQKAKRKPLFKVGAKANVGFPKINETKQVVKKSFAPSNHIFKAPVNVKAIELNAVKKTVDTFKRVTRSQKPQSSPLLSLPIRSRKKQIKELNKNEKSENKIKSKLLRQNAFDDNSQETTNKLKKANKENIDLNVDGDHNITEARTKRRSFGMNLENYDTSKKTTLSKQISTQIIISDSEDNTKKASNKKQSRRKSFRKSTSKANSESDSNGTYKFINSETTPIKDEVFSPVAAYVKNKRRSLRLNVENNEKQNKSISNEETSKKKTASKRKSETEDNTHKKSLNKRQSRKKSPRKSISSTDKESDLNSTYELINPDQITPIKDDVFSPVATYISPFVTTSRGKGSLKKENKERSTRGLPSFTEFNTPDEGANSSFQITGALYFHTSLNNEISRLTSMCKTWNTYKENSANLPEDANDLIDVAVGQANLLMNKKFQQFRKLIVSCENGYGEEKPVTCEDLQGFWDMIYIQVENLNTRFNRLEELKNQNWQDIIPVVQQKIVKKGGNKKRVKSAPTSSLRAAIEAARKKTKSATSDEDTIFNGGFFIVKSPQKKSHTPEKMKTKTPVKNRQSLLKSVLSSETKKSSRKSIGSPGINMMKASQTAKSVENLNFTLPTPGKSILKKTTRRKSIAHTSKAVLFKDYGSDSE